MAWTIRWRPSRKAVYFIYDWQHPDSDLRHEYEKLQARIPEGAKKLAMDDPEADWAVSKKAAEPQGSGHSIPEA